MPEQRREVVEILRRDKRYWLVALTIFLVTAWGCSHPNAPPPNPVSQPEQPPVPAGPTYGPAPSPAPTPTSAPAPSYGPKTKLFEFNDIPLPAEMNVRPNHSYIFQSGQIKIGFLTLRGRVDSNSLVNFFGAALPREGWRLKAQFRYGRSLLVFDKPDKVCVILLREETYYTYVEIYVSPVGSG
jgi:hypothetical protein